MGAAVPEKESCLLTLHESFARESVGGTGCGLGEITKRALHVTWYTLLGTSDRLQTTLRYSFTRRTLADQRQNAFYMDHMVETQGCARNVICRHRAGFLENGVVVRWSSECQATQAPCWLHKDDVAAAEAGDKVWYA